MPIIEKMQHFQSSSRYLILTTISLFCLSAYAWAIWHIRFSVSDAVAQFLPVSLEGYRALKSGNLPLYNFYQYMGHPVLEMAYFPVLYPLFFISSLIAEFGLREVQLAWDVLGILQTILAGMATFLFFDKVLKLRFAPLSMLGAITASFLGNNLYMRGEFFYGTVCYTFIPLVLYCLKRLLLSNKPLDALWLALTIYFFIISSNIQYLFYSAHLIVFGIVAILISVREELQTKAPWGAFLVSRAKVLFLCWLMILLLAAPYFYGMAQFQHDSIRQTEKVPIEQYFWITNHPLFAWKYMPLPFANSGEQGDYYQIPYSYYCGPLSMLGVLLSPLLLVASALKRKRKVFVITALFFCSGILFFLLSIGEAGKIGGYLYNFPPYNWFRQSIKWTPFFQMSVVYLGFFVCDQLVTMFSKLHRLQILLLCGSTVLVGATTVWAITISQTPKRLTEVEVPLPKPSLAVDSNYRHLGIWTSIKAPGDEYKTDMPGRLLCFNIGSYWQLPMAAGYEPRAWRQNLELAKGNWFPGCFYKPKDVDLEHFSAWSVRYLRVPKEDAESTLTYFRHQYPQINLALLGIDQSLDVAVIENKSAPKLVFGENILVSSIKIDSGRSVVAELEVNSPGFVTFSWAHNRFMRAKLDGRFAEALKDPLGRIQVMVRTPGKHIVEIAYRPKTLLRLYQICGSLFIILVLAVLFLHFRPTKSAL